MGAGWSDREDEVEPEWMHRVDVGLCIFIAVMFSITVIAQVSIWWRR